MSSFEKTPQHSYHLTIDGSRFEVVGHEKALVATQPGDRGQEFDLRIQNWGLGWGESRYEQPGTYDYGNPAVLHRRGVYLPGSAVTALAPSTAPTGDVTFGEYWDGTTANRRLLVVGARQVYEINSAGTISVNSLTTQVGASAVMGRPVLFKVPAMAAPRVYIPVKGASAADDFVVRTAANTYAKNTGSNRAWAMAAGKDIDGEDVMYRVDETMRLKLTTANSDPDASGSWASSDYGVGQTAALVTDLYHNGKYIMVGKEDGAWMFDQRLNSIPLTPGMNQTPDPANFTFFKDYNGQCIAPTAQGIIWMDGLEYGVTGPVSANRQALNLRGLEQAVSASAGDYVYASVYYGGSSYIFCGTPRNNGDKGNPNSPITWHGPIAVVTGFQLTDLFVSTVWGTKLWWGAAAKFGYINLNADDLSPATDSSSGHIYLPDGILDVDGPGVIKDYRKVEFVTRAGAAFGAANQWTLGIEATPGSGTYTNVDGGYTTTGDGVVASRFWSTEMSGKRLRARLSYQNNAGAAELEAVILRGTQRQERTWEHQFTLKHMSQQRGVQGNRSHKLPNDTEVRLDQLEREGRNMLIVYGDRSFTGYVRDIAVKHIPGTKLTGPEAQYTVTFREVALT